MVTPRIKASDRAKACQQIVAVLKKQYGSRTPTLDYNVLDTLLYAICLENASYAQAEQALKKLQDSFFDYNEIRVTSITELMQVFDGMTQPEWRAMRIREALQLVFEGRYNFDLEELKKKTLDAAEKSLQKFPSLTPFVLSHTLLFALGSHLVPIDEHQRQAAIWIGLLEEETDLNTAADQFKAAVRKAEVPLFSYLLNSLANDPAYIAILTCDNPLKPENPVDAVQASAGLLKKLFAGDKPLAALTPPVAKEKPASTKTAAEKVAVEKIGAEKPAAEKASSDKQSAKSSVAKGDASAPKKKPSPTPAPAAKKPASSSAAPKAAKKTDAPKKKTKPGKK